MAQQILFIDDRDPSIDYASAPGDISSWSQDENVLEFNQSATWTVRAQARVSIPFNGTAISVWGTLGSSAAGSVLTSYQVDSLPIIRVENSSLLDQAQFQVMFYQSPGLRQGPHNLLITNMANGSLFQFDFAKVAFSNATLLSNVHPPPTINSSSAESSSTLASSSSSLIRDSTLLFTDITSPTTSTNIIVSSTADPTVSSLSDISSDGSLRTTSSGDSTTSAATASITTSATASSSTSNGSSHGRVAPIIGGILGALLLIFIFSALLLRSRKQRKKKGRRIREQFLTGEKGRFSFLPSMGTSSEDLQPFGLPKSEEVQIDGAGYQPGRSSANELLRRDFASAYDPFSASQVNTTERSAWSPEPTERTPRGIGKTKGYRQSPPKYNSGLFYHLDPV